MKPITCKTGEYVTTYRDYLKTDHWKNTRERYKQSKFKYKCIACGTDKKLNLHHKSYKRVGNERLTDLVWLCEECHLKVHVKEKESTKNLWTVTRKVSKKIRKSKALT